MVICITPLERSCRVNTGKHNEYTKVMGIVKDFKGLESMDWV